MSEREEIRRALLAKRNTATTSKAPDYGTFTEAELEARLLALETRDEVDRDQRHVRWQSADDERRDRDAKRLEARLAAAAAAARELRNAIVAGAVGLVVVVLAALAVGGAICTVAQPPHSERVLGAAVLVSLAIYLLAIAWMSLSLVNGWMSDPEEE